MEQSRHHNTRLTVHEVFKECTGRGADRIAIAMGSRLLSYGQLNQQADDLAAHLGKLRLGPGTRVGVCLPRCPELIGSILAILKAGAAYVPLDPEYPADRLELMIADAQLAAVLTGAEPPAGIAGSSLPVLNVAQGWPTEPVQAIANCVGQSADAPAYLMYTSGSTGQPKGVVIPHRGITRLVCSPDYVDICEDDVFLQLAPISFDASTFEIWGALLNGARLAIMPPGHSSLAEIGEAIRREGVTILWLTGGLFNLMVDERLDDLRPLKQLLVGGEALSVAHVEKARAALDGTQLINGYGPTENTTFTCCHRIGRRESFPRGVPIGRPIRGTRVKVVDAQMKEVALGEEGELLAGGEGVALGYWNRAELTAERFLCDVTGVEGGGLFYRTGDFVRMRQDGNLEFLGRRDEQVKLRGFRIETGEIEAAVRTHPGVRDCAVKVSMNQNGQGQLVAYVVRHASPALGEQQLLAHVASLLPSHMRPGNWVFLDELPLNPNGKVDRARLPAPDFIGEAVLREPPRNHLERLLVELWEALLGGRPVGATESYFELGANSLLVAQAHERLCRRHGFSLPLTDLFRFTTVRSLADHLQRLENNINATDTEAVGKRAQLRAAALQRFAKR